MSTSRKSLVQALVDAQRAVGTQTVLLSQAIANRLGIHPTDLETMDLLARRGRLTAGEVATETGLTTAAVTALIDRLEARGFARRLRDPQDRRRVFVELDEVRTTEEVMPFYAELLNSSADLHRRYSDTEIEAIERFLRESHEMLLRETERLRGRSGDKAEI